MFKSKYIYLKIKHDFIEVTNLETTETISKSAVRPFSSTRNVVSNFSNANETIEFALNELGIRTGFLRPGMKILVHQLEGLEGGLSDIEKRALRDLAEQAGANKVFIVEQPDPLSIELALTRLKEH